MCQQTNQPAEKNVTKAGSVTMFPVSSTAVPEPSVMQQNMSPVPESIEPTRNKSIPAATAQSAVAFDELGGELVGVVQIQNSFNEINFVNTRDVWNSFFISVRFEKISVFEKVLINADIIAICYLCTSGVVKLQLILQRYWYVEWTVPTRLTTACLWSGGVLKRSLSAH